MEHPNIFLFDFDGVIITQKALEYTALELIRNKTFRIRNNEHLRLIDYAKMFELSDSNNKIEALIQAFRNYKEIIPSRWRRLFFFYLFRKRYKKYEKIYEELEPNIEELLNLLKVRGNPMAIVSNTNRPRLNFFKNKFSLDRFFRVIITQDDVPYRKPHAYPILRAIQLIKREFGFAKIDRNKVFMIGDLPSDIASAKAAKIKSIAILSGHGNTQELEKLKPDLICKNLTALLKEEIPYL
ncbi:MAG: HAD hydrolase-like protein [Candidatus Lokiarchaeota archaeon]|nr:HAD hydrolase-like protein [Candidatus Lokiarchaeota archaeon]